MILFTLVRRNSHREPSSTTTLGKRILLLLMLIRERSAAHFCLSKWARVLKHWLCLLCLLWLQCLKLLQVVSSAERICLLHIRLLLLLKLIQTLLLSKRILVLLVELILLTLWCKLNKCWLLFWLLVLSKSKRTCLVLILLTSKNSLWLFCYEGRYLDRFCITCDRFYWLCHKWRSACLDRTGL